jgi:rare lipoprotein A
MSRRICSLATVFAVLAFLALGVARAEEGIAVHYSDRFQGRTTASGETFDQQALTAAHKKLPFGTQVKVTNLDNNQSVVLKINDRMARKNRNLIDVTRRAARELGFEKKGRARVRIDVAQ